MKKVFMMLLATTLIGFAACSDEDAIGEAPEIESIELIPNPCHRGDTVVMRVHYNESQKGSHFYFTEYKINGLIPLSATKKDSQRGILLGYEEPTIKCQAADTVGTFTVSFQGMVSFTGNKAVVDKDSKGNKVIQDGILYGKTNPVTAQLIIQ